MGTTHTMLYYDVLRLYYPPTFPKSVEFFHGKCGAGSGLGEKLVPETIWFLNITPACKIHDHMYAIADPTDEAKKEADRTFRNNMIRIVHYHTDSVIITRLRLNRANVYYRIVKDFGGPAFWNNKN